MLQCRGSNSIQILDRKLNKQVDFPGRENDFSSETQTRLAQTLERQPHFSNEGDQMIWFADKWSISVVDLRDLSQIIIENGLKAIMQQQGLDKIPEPVMTIADFSVNKILVVYNLEGKHLLVWHQENK